MFCFQIYQEDRMCFKFEYSDWYYNTIILFCFNNAISVSSIFFTLRIFTVMNTIILVSTNGDIYNNWSASTRTFYCDLNERKMCENNLPVFSYSDLVS